MLTDLSQLRQRLGGAPVVTRFAPSPTGYLHLGHLASALYVWGIGRSLGARILLRIEDHDQGRSRQHYEEAILEDLEWLGLTADPSAGEKPFERQSDRHGIYRRHLDALGSEGGVYGCRCSRKEIRAELSRKGIAEEAELYYPGTCRKAGHALDGPDTGVRLELPEETVSFEDAYLGFQTQTPARQCGDVLVRDRMQQWTYQYAVTVDDWEQGVNLVIRGQDLAESTGRQILLARRLGRERCPTFLHHPLITEGDGRKKSKRFFSESLRSRRERGETAAQLLGEAAFEVGLTSTQRPLTAEEIPSLFHTKGERA